MEQIKIKVRKAEITDLDAILELNLKLFKYERRFGKTYSLDWTYSKKGKNYFALRIKRKEGIILVAIVGGEIIGYICGDIHETLERIVKKMSEVENFFVKDNFRRKGVGTKLFEEFKIQAKRKGAKRIKAIPVSGNKRAIKFYEKDGFKPQEIVLEREI